jgi:hypothetical protein
MTPACALTLTGCGAAIAAAAAVRHMVRRHGTVVLLHRWFTGHTLHGKYVTDAGWLTPASKVLHPTGRASRWAHLPRAHRAAYRTGGTIAAAASLWGLAAHRAITLRALESGALAGLGLGGWLAWRGLRSRRHVRAHVRPLHRALAPVLGVPLARAPGAWLDVPHNYSRTEGARISVALPDHFSGGTDARRLVADVVTSKLALEDPGIAWHTSGASPHVTFTVQVPPPESVSLADVAELVRLARDTAPLVGLGRAGKPVYADLDGDSPHVLISAGSGGGKSVTTRLLLAQILARGGVGLVLDVKRLSHAWARGLPNVRYCRDIAEIHDALLWLRDELDTRNRLADEGADAEGNTDHVDVGPRIGVLAEEMNATINRLAAYWRSIKGRDDPAMSPAIEALGDALFMGRQVKVNVLAVAQMFTARTAGGPEARENMGVRILARYTLNNWRILVPEIWPAPRASRHRGRVQVCAAGHARETQVAFLAPSEARALASSGTLADFPAEGTPRHAEGLHLVGGEAEPIGLGQAVRCCSRGLLRCQLASSVRR